MKVDAEKYTVIFGSNVITDCPRVIELKGKGINKQILRFKEGQDGKILCDCTVKNQKNETIAKIANSKLQYVAEGYRADISSEIVKIVEETTNVIWLDFESIGPRRFKLNGMFFIPGYRIVATDDFLEINTNKISNCVFDSCSAAIGLG